MRTTVTLDPDTEQMVRQRMAARGVSFKRALNDAIREGARAEARVDAFHTPVFEMGVPRADLTRALRVAADLEDEAITQRLLAD